MESLRHAWGLLEFPGPKQDSIFLRLVEGRTTDDVRTPQSSKPSSYANELSLLPSTSLYSYSKSTAPKRGNFANSLSDGVSLTDSSPAPGCVFPVS